jgi:hypothetical protein
MYSIDQELDTVEYFDNFLQVFVDEKIMAQDLKEHILEILDQL